MVTEKGDTPLVPESVANAEEGWWRGSNSRVFISCGQGSSEEISAARSVLAVIQDEGYSAFLSVDTHSTTGLWEWILAHLQTADYFLFIDFKREEARDLKSGELFHRGSLYSHQELGIATYLKHRILPFKQRDVRREGILGSIAGNAVDFGDYGELPALVKATIKKEGWSTSSRHEIRATGIRCENHATLLGRDLGLGPWAIYCHIRVENLHSTLPANDCRALLEGVSSQQGDSWQDRPADPIELKWMHVTSPLVTIPPKGAREFDAIVFSVADPRLALPGLNFPTIDNNVAQRIYRLEGPGKFRLRFVLYSREFAALEIPIELELGVTPEDRKLEMANGPPLGLTKPVMLSQPMKEYAAQDTWSSPSTITVKGVYQ